MSAARVQVAIIGGGPSGLLLSQLLNRAGIETLVLERRSRAHVLSRIRAGVLEPGTAELLRRAGVGARMDAEGQSHSGVILAGNDRYFRIDFASAGAKHTVLYGQSEITRDLYLAQDAMGTRILHEVEDVALHGLTDSHARVSWRRNGVEEAVVCDFVAGCDGFHGVSRMAIPVAARTEFTKSFPFAWLGILAPVAPAAEELVYAAHPNGFALASMRSPSMSRCYIQVQTDERIENWTDGRFWQEFRTRLPPAIAERVQTGTSIEKSITPMRAFVCEPMRWGRLFLCGDSAHIVPPTGAKGLNLAASDAGLLAHGLRDFFQDGDSHGIDRYSELALARVWRGVQFSIQMTRLMHRSPGQDAMETRLQLAALRQIEQDPTAQRQFAESYTGCRNSPP